MAWGQAGHRGAGGVEEELRISRRAARRPDPAEPGRQSDGAAKDGWRPKGTAPGVMAPQSAARLKANGRLKAAARNGRPTSSHGRPRRTDAVGGGRSHAAVQQPKVSEIL